MTESNNPVPSIVQLEDGTIRQLIEGFRGGVSSGDAVEDFPIDSYDPVGIELSDAVTDNQAFQIVTVNSASLLRVDSLIDGNNGTVFSTIPVQIRLYAVTVRNPIVFPPPTSPINELYPPDAFLRGVGPFLFLPRRGQYRVYMQAEVLTGANSVRARCTILQGIEIALAAKMMAGEFPHGWVEGGITLGAGGESIIPDPVTVGAAGSIGMARYFGLTNLSIYNSGANPLHINMGQIATAGNGQLLAAGASNLKGWAEMAGLSVHVQSALGTSVVWRARYI